MSSMPPRPGFTKSGKSLKAVRRYYAMLNAGKDPNKNVEPPGKDVVPSPMDQTNTVPKNKVKSPRDDQLTNRIADELKSQKNANVMRGVELSTAPTERSGLPMAQQAGQPAFQTVPKAKSAKSIKSTTSVKSLAWNSDSGPITSGVVMACFMIGLVYIVAWISTLFLKRKPGDDNQHNLLTWPGITSVAVIVASLLHMFWKTNCIAVTVSLIISFGSTLSLVAYIILEVVVLDQSKQKIWFTRENPMRLWLPLFYLLYTFIMSSIILKNMLSNAFSKSEARASDNPPPQLSDMAA